MAQHFRRQQRTTLSLQSEERKQQEEICQFNPQSKYAKLYEKYTSEASDTFNFDFEDMRRTSACDNVVLEKAKVRIRELSMENAGLKEELKERKEQIERMKYELYYCNSQLQQIHKIESYQYQQAVNDLRSEIECILQKNKITEEELARVKLTQSSHDKQYDQKRQGRHLGEPQRENQPHSISAQHTRQIESNSLFIIGLKDMYAKIEGSSAKSLKQLWKWLKNIGQLSSRLRKWRRQVHQFIKSCLLVNLQQVMPFLEEAMIIIN